MDGVDLGKVSIIALAGPVSGLAWMRVPVVFVVQEHAVVCYLE